WPWVMGRRREIYPAPRRNGRMAVPSALVNLKIHFVARLGVRNTLCALSLLEVCGVPPCRHPSSVAPENRSRLLSLLLAARAEQSATSVAGFHAGRRDITCPSFSSFPATPRRGQRRKTRRAPAFRGSKSGVAPPG